MSVTSRGILRGYLSRFQSTDQLTSQVVSVQRLTHLATAQVVGSFWIDYKIATVETFREPYLVPPSGEHVSSTWFCLSNVFSFAMREIMATVVWGGNEGASIIQLSSILAIWYMLCHIFALLLRLDKYFNGTPTPVSNDIRNAPVVILTALSDLLRGIMRQIGDLALNTVFAECQEQLYTTVACGNCLRLTTDGTKLVGGTLRRIFLLLCYSDNSSPEIIFAKSIFIVLLHLFFLVLAMSSGNDICVNPTTSRCMRVRKHIHDNAGAETDSAGKGQIKRSEDHSYLRQRGALSRSREYKGGAAAQTSYNMCERAVRLAVWNIGRLVRVHTRGGKATQRSNTFHDIREASSLIHAVRGSRKQLSARTSSAPENLRKAAIERGAKSDRNNGPSSISRGTAEGNAGGIGCDLLLPPAITLLHHRRSNPEQKTTLFFEHEAQWNEMRASARG
ncbi:hypothetical protein POSPLADRAFT_1034119 [Postia placenta MAD-698-R-SB12]|uniref:Uncharacterized protein n=1 Tax=Postia placenta MAD-698-R-SB12 TaxID=670580 RepID=A0A1X6MYP1_9APHY|nr:hypothetical protein POSPLADRAFT_1034119 [Postia placenta MAD-698-R-SB12]OSX61479.1 hypothetical protein POSPLADRAFT_1034119 [Postia placenta MAD-698-R-SB12]